MKRVAIWAAGLWLAAGAVFYVGYLWRDFALLLVGAALVLAAGAVLFKPLRSLLISLVSVALALALAELGLGILERRGPAQAYFDPSTDYVKHYWSHNDIGARPKVGKHGTRKLDPQGQTIYDTSYTIGDDGFRVTPGNPASATHKVNFLGDSVMFGEGLADDQTIPAQVQRLMPDVRVKNFGIHGYGMHQALAILESPLDNSGQVNFVLTAPWHAERSACLPAYTLGSPRYVLQADGNIKRDGVCGGISYYPLARILSLSRAYTLVKTAWLSRQGQDAQFELYLALIREIVKLSDSRHQTTVIGFLRHHDNWFTGSYSNQKVMDAIRAMKVEVVDVSLADNTGAVDPRYILSKYDEHPNALGNEVRAPLVAQAVRQALGVAR